MNLSSIFLKCQDSFIADKLTSTIHQDRQNGRLPHKDVDQQILDQIYFFPTSFRPYTLAILQLEPKYNISNKSRFDTIRLHNKLDKKNDFKNQIYENFY